MKSDRQLLLLLGCIYAFAVGSVIIGNSAEIIVAVAKAGVNQEWLGFAGSFPGGLMTIVAGAIAWIAAQRTIEASQTLAERRERNTCTVIQHELKPGVEMFVRYWRIIQKALRSNNTTKANGVALIRSITDHGISDDRLDEMRKLGSNLNLINRRDLLEVLQGLRLVREQLKAEVTDHNRANNCWSLSLRTMLSHFERHLREFDSEMAKRFDEFTKSQIDHRDLAEHIDPLITQFQETGNIA